MRIRFIFLLLTGYLGLSAQIVKSIPFSWSDAELNGEYFEKTAMHIPVQFGDDTTSYYFQFDTGANKSFLYIKDNPNTRLVESCKSGALIPSSLGDLNLIPISSSKSYIKRYA